MPAHHFLLVFAYADNSVFACINSLRHSLNLALKGKYQLDIAFNKSPHDYQKKYQLAAVPALIDLGTSRIIYGSSFTKIDLKNILDS